ncbi:MAG TPA: ATP synthase F1 subunit gamma [Patescibacteria group bacterium]|jgi:F-type H+-transporting ATPase subunit gamma|nr:ATP synthase F1 subunit gamma [Patescibacteria group bacterium]
MAVSTRDIRRRIKSVKNIAQITKAMELVSAAKMRKAQSQATSSRPYAVLSSNLLKNLAGKTNLPKHPLIQRVLPEGEKMPVQKILAIIITSDKGLAGALNSNVISKALRIIKEEGKEKFDVITVGRKGLDAARRMKLNIAATFEAKDKNVSVLDAKPIAQIATTDYLAFKYEKVFIVYTDFISTLVQKANILQILPFAQALDANEKDDYLFEPDADEVLENLVYRTIEFAIYQCLVEAVASEHSARMVAMRNANDAASDLIEDLTLSANQARQAGITKELSEISAAKIAME